MVEKSKTKKQKLQEETRELVTESYCSVKNKGSTAYLLCKQSVSFSKE